MSTTPVVTKWNDSGAPTLNGVAGTLIAVLDAALVTGAGWSKVYSGTNKAVYRAPAGRQFYLRVDDTGTTSARIVGYETMSDVDTGTGPFPTAAQVSGGLYVIKSNAADATARAWAVYANDRAFYIWHNIANAVPSSNTSNAVINGFGDLITFNPSDAYGTFIMAATSASVGADFGANHSGSFSTVLTGHYACRDATGIAGAKQGGKVSDIPNSTASMGSGGPSYPHPVDGKLHLARERWLDGSVGLRGFMPGYYAPQHASFMNFFSSFDTVTGSGALTGKSFDLLHSYSSASCAIDKSDWGA